MTKDTPSAATTCNPEGVPGRDATERPWSRLPELALAACAGASDLLALLTHEGTFASVVTGNVALVGAEAATGDFRGLVTPATAVTGFIVGVAIWHGLWRDRPQALVGMLATELALLIGYATVWLVTRGTPSVVGGAAMLMVIAVAMGGSKRRLDAHARLHDLPHRGAHRSGARPRCTSSGAAHERAAAARRLRCWSLSRHARVPPPALVGAAVAGAVVDGGPRRDSQSAA